MIFSIITAAGVVIYTMGPWPTGALQTCHDKAAEIAMQNSETAVRRQLKFWCAEFSQKPELGQHLAAPAEAWPKDTDTQENAHVRME